MLTVTHARAEARALTEVLCVLPCPPRSNLDSCGTCGARPGDEQPVSGGDGGGSVGLVERADGAVTRLATR